MVGEDRFVDEQGRPALARCALLFVDLLGVSAMAQSESEAAQRLIELDTALRGTYRNFLREDSPWPAAMFSDTLVVASPVLEIGGDEETATGGLLVQAAWLQLNLAVKGFFLRGGLSLGPFHITEGLLFGPALVAAYQLEQEAAVNPRIVLSDDFANAQRDALVHYGEPRQSPQNELLLVDQDGRPFVSYLSPLLDELDDPQVALADHRDVVVNKLDVTRNDSRLWEKYRWVADYHNAFCDQAFPGHVGLLIDTAKSDRRFRAFVE